MCPLLFGKFRIQTCPVACTGKQLPGGRGNPETDGAVVLARRIEGMPERSTDGPRITVETVATKHLGITGRRSSGIISGTAGIIVPVVPVRHPLPDIAGHVIETQRV